MTKPSKIIVVFIALILFIIMISCSSVGKVIMRKKWKLDEYDDWYVIVKEGKPVGYMHYKLDRYHNSTGEQRYEEDTHRVIYSENGGGDTKKITRSWVKTDKDFNILQFQFYSTPMYATDKERINRGIIKEDKLSITANNATYDIPVGNGIPSLLNYRHIVNTMVKQRGKHTEYKFFSLRYLTEVKESIVYSGEKSVEYKGERVLSDKFLIMPYKRNESMDSYYFTKDGGRLLMATMFQGRLYYQLSDMAELKDIFKFED